MMPTQITKPTNTGSMKAPTEEDWASVLLNQSAVYVTYGSKQSGKADGRSRDAAAEPIPRPYSRAEKNALMYGLSE